MPHRSWSLALTLVLLLGAPACADPAVDRALAAFQAAYGRATNFRGRVKLMEWKGTQHTTMRVDLALEKPNRTAMTILEAPEARLSEGTKIVWTGGRKVKVRTRFFGFPLRLETGVDDDRLRDLRGQSLEDLNIVRAMAIVSRPGTALKLLGAERYQERPVSLMEIRSPDLLPGVEREVVWLDEALHLPVVREMYSNGTRVYRLEVESYALDAVLGPEVFSAE